MSCRDNILNKLHHLQHDVCESLIYQLLLYCDKVTFSNSCINVYAIKRPGLIDLLNGRTLMKINLTNGKIIISLPAYTDNPVYQCNIDSSYVNGNSVKLVNVFVNIYNSIFNKLEYQAISSVEEILFLVGISNKAIKKDFIIRVYNKGNIYSDLSSRLLNSFDILFEDILYFRSKYNANDILRRFSGLVLNGEISDDIAKGIVYLKSNNEMKLNELERFPSLKYADIICEYDIYLCSKYNALRINNTQIQGNSPYESFIKKR